MKNWFAANILPENYYQKIHDASLKILKETGVVFHSDLALDIFKKHGARVEGQTVYLSPQMVEDSLQKCPEKFIWEGRDPQYTVTVGDGSLLIQPNVGPVYVEDIERGRRQATIEDYANIIRLCHASPEVQLNGSIPADPHDIPVEKKHLHIMYQILKNTTKPIIGTCTDRETVKLMLEMTAIAMGRRNNLQQSHVIGVLVNPLSPLAYSQETADTIIEYSRQNQIILLAPCIMAGISGPIYPLGTALLQNTEILAGITLAQLVNPGTPIVYATASTSGYMKNASYAAGTPEAMLINMPNLQMGKYFYHMPTRTMCGITHSKMVDCQAGYETMMSLMLGMMSEADIFVQCLGVLDAIMTTSFEKFIIDEELLSRIRRIRKGIEISNEALSVETIQEIGAENSYLTHPSTIQKFRELWTPTVSDWDSYNDWDIMGRKDVVAKAHARYKKILSEAPDTLLDKELEKELQAFLK
jgi:trimethylamine--corrinoid protein Co-methyltransferase